jgi:hypothetical protein
MNVFIITQKNSFLNFLDSLSLLFSKISPGYIPIPYILHPKLKT